MYNHGQIIEGCFRTGCKVLGLKDFFSYDPFQNPFLVILILQSFGVTTRNFHEREMRKASKRGVHAGAVAVLLCHTSLLTEDLEISEPSEKLPPYCFLLSELGFQVF
jgi:hypothetical protein